MKFTKYLTLSNRKVIIIGFGSIGPAALLLILRHIDINPAEIEIISDSLKNQDIAENHGVKFSHFKLMPENYKKYLVSKLTQDDILINLSVEISSIDLIKLCQEMGVLYLDTSNEAWPSNITGVRTGTYERRQKMQQETNHFSTGVTALVCHGANPGLITHFAKQAVLDVGNSIKNIESVPQSANEWANIAQASDIVSLHISERDTQASSIKRIVDEYVNTWSIEGLFEEASENVGFAWGTHEEELPREMVKNRIDGEKCRIIELNQLGVETQINSWVPSKGMFTGFLMPHVEAYSIAELFSRKVLDNRYQPTVHFVYHPCWDAIDSMRHAMAQGWVNINHKRLLGDDILEGKDELGILVVRKHSPDIYWFGSRLDIKEARSLIPHNNATSVQVAVGILSGLVWIIENPQCGIVEPEQVDFKRVLEIAAPYLGEFGGHWAKWPEEHFPKMTGHALKQHFYNSSKEVT
ncbi:MAG TPA: saccharopine dehydrogenase NADP-binding domain-containing protein [Gammaproteobacteria bacterium]|nr:saccharopine dehydrogenase NADP-binding domain-containing protein [Gammaproteobacteria bacterium]HQZ87876.1 saccharopine dehydrogenase NADP-binding domain-containing protein [Gammaproteobacteria bacterium]HRA43229.1 saccharopine dehydrogenase NADP-binding domain-containing protein [Gammaproteobacteria bacterium]